MKIIFMGTPEFAVPALKALTRSGDKIVAVYTQPPRRAGRGKEEQKSPVHIFAESENLPVRTPVSLKDENAQREFASFNTDIAVVAAYGLILPKAILDSPKFGCINIHPSLLPRWRGAAPIQHTIMAGDKKTGVCIMQMDEGLDTGGIMLSEEYQLSSKITFGELHDELAEIGARLALRSLDLLGDNIEVKPQAENGATYASKITKSDTKIDFSRSALEIERQIRAFAPKPGAYFEYNNEKIKILEAEAEMLEHYDKPGSIFDHSTFTIACGKGYLKPLKLQRPGKKALDTQDFLRGFALS